MFARGAGPGAATGARPPTQRHAGPPTRAIPPVKAAQRGRPLALSAASMAPLNLSTLNPPQREAVTTLDGPLLVLAGAGSGKTRVIVHRIAYLIERGVSPDRILAMTFTNKAAAEMKERVGQLVSRAKANELTVGTFHAFGLQVVREQHAKVGLPRRFAIADGKDQESLVRRAMRDVKIDDRAFDPRRVLSLVSLARCEGVKPGEPTRGPLKPTLFGEEYDAIAQEVYPRYLRALRAMGLVDFDDLIDLPIALLREHPEVLARYHERFHYLLVDEYQDTNKTQLELLELLGKPRGNVCAVGDDDQSIYGWRGAEVENILRFHLYFPGGKEVRLEQNYRSTGRILACANEVIAKNEARKPKRLFTASGPGEKVKVVTCPRDEEEARFVVNEIRAGIAAGQKPGDFAILYRTNLQSRPYEEALRTEGIPYDLVGGTEFFDRREVKDLLAYLKLFLNPQDEISLLRIVNFPARGIGDVTVEKIRHRATTEALPLLEAFRKAASGAWEEVAPAAKRVQAFVDLVDRRGKELAEGGSPSKLARELLEETGFREAVAATFTSAEAASKRLGLLDDLLVSLERFEKREGKRASLAQYLAQLTMDRRDDEPPAAGNAVRLSSLHAAKGLEFPVVFLPGWEEDLFPHKGIQGTPQDLAEERRLAYVGITRARERLFITRAAARVSRGKETPRTPSRFLSDLPQDAIEELDLAVPTPESEKRSETFFSDLIGQLSARRASGTPAGRG